MLPCAASSHRYAVISMQFLVLVNLAVFAGLIVFIAAQRGRSLSTQILIGLVLGAAFGLLMQFMYSGNPGVIAGTLEWTNVVGTSYINLLRMVIMPLVLVMMIAAVVRMKEMGALGRYGGTIVAILVGTTMIAAFIGVMMASVFGLSMDGMTEGARELARAEALEQRLESIQDLGVADMLIRFIPSNVFYDLTGARPTSIIAVVIFGILFGIAALLVSQEDEEKGKAIFSFVDTIQAIVMKLVRMIMLLTPYGILALLTKVVAGSNGEDIVNLLTFIVASYLAIALMFVVHALLLKLNGVNVADYFRKVWPVLTFAFSSRSSAATIPLNVETQVDELKSAAPDCESFGHVRRNDWPERLCRHLPGDAGDHDRADHGHQSARSGILLPAHRYCRYQLVRYCGRRWWRNVRGSGCASGHGYANCVGGTADIHRATDRHGADRAER